MHLSNGTLQINFFKVGTYRMGEDKAFISSSEIYSFSGLLSSLIRIQKGKRGLRIRIPIGSGFNLVSGSGSIFGIRIQEG